MEKKIKYLALYRYLTDTNQGEGLKPFEAVRNINRIRNIKNPAILAAMKSYFENRITPEININGVTFQQLVNNEDMKPVRAFLMLDWLDSEPLEAMNYLMSDRLKSPMPELTNNQRNELDAILNKIKSEHPEVVTEIPEEDPSKCSEGEDVVFNDAPSCTEEPK